MGLRSIGREEDFFLGISNVSVYSEKLTSASGSEILKVIGIELSFSTWAEVATLASYMNLNWFKFSGLSGRRVFKVT